jgi:hypothetical protein
MKKVFKDEFKKTKDAGKGFVKKVTSKSTEKNQGTPVYNTPQQPVPNEMQDIYKGLQNFKQERVNSALSDVQKFNEMMGTPKKKLTDEEMTQWEKNYLNSRACLAILNFCRDINLLVNSYKQTAPKEVLAAAVQLKIELMDSINAGFRDYLINQPELEIVEKNLLSISDRLLHKYSPVIEEDPGFFASLIRLFNYLFGCCLSEEVSTKTVFGESAQYQHSKFSIFQPEVKESPNSNEVSSQVNSPK